MKNLSILKKLIVIIFMLGLAACASPAEKMTSEQVSTLSNNQLCQLKDRYGWEEKTELEIGRRNLNCDPVYNECVNSGIDPKNSAAITLCMNNIRQNQALQEQLQKQTQEQQMELERLRNQARLQSLIQNKQQHKSLRQQALCQRYGYCQ